MLTEIYKLIKLKNEKVYYVYCLVNGVIYNKKFNSETDAREYLSKFTGKLINKTEV